MHPFRFALTAPDRPALVLVDEGRSISYRDLNDRSNQSARLLRQLGLKRGDVVATVFGNGEEAFILGWAAQRSGLYATSISCRLSEADLKYIIEDCGAKVVLASNAHADIASAALASLPGVRGFVWNGSHAALGNWSELAAAMPAEPVADESPGSDLLYSSGTTGRPKGIKPPLPEGAIDAETPLMMLGRALFGMREGMQYLNTSPLYHSAPIRWGMTAQRFGGTVVVMDRFDAALCLDLIEAHRISHATFVPTHFVRMLKLPEAERSGRDLSSLESAIHAAAPCPVEVKQRMIEWLGPILHEYYSGTEMCGMTAIDSHDWLGHIGSVGKAVLGRVHIVSDEGEELGANETGGVWFSDGPSFEYLNDPEKTAASHNDRGWATLGDIGHLDSEGYLYLTDRKSFMIISGGVNIYPQEIENLLITHDAVADVAVFGIPDPDLGERAIAVVQPAPHVTPDAELGGLLARFARDHLGGVKTPKEFHFESDLPREPTGKLLKKLLVSRYS